jgi:hypothetical protein
MTRAKTPAKSVFLKSDDSKRPRKKLKSGSSCESRANTRYKDYPVSSSVLHWESQSKTTRNHADGQNYIHFRERGYTILFFARLEKGIAGETAPFIFLGPAKDLLSYQGDRPIQMLWELEHAMPAMLFEEARTA